MLDQTFGRVYTKFKLHFYKQIFSRFEDREATLTTVESFCMEVIMALGEPTIAQFSHMMNLSTPNAAYKINSLVKKGYVERIQSTIDKRQYRLRPTQKEGSPADFCLYSGDFGLQGNRHRSRYRTGESRFARALKSAMTEMKGSLST